MHGPPEGGRQRWTLGTSSQGGRPPASLLLRMQGTSGLLGTPHSVLPPSQRRRHEGAVPGARSRHRRAWGRAGRLSTDPAPKPPAAPPRPRPATAFPRSPDTRPPPARLARAAKARPQSTHRSCTAGPGPPASPPPGLDARPRRAHWTAAGGGGEARGRRRPTPLPGFSWS